MDYTALYTEWTVNENDERILRKSVESNGTFKMPPSGTFWERNYKMKMKNPDSVFIGSWGIYE